MSGCANMWPFRPKLETMHSPLITPLTIQFFLRWRPAIHVLLERGIQNLTRQVCRLA